MSAITWENQGNDLYFIALYVIIRNHILRATRCFRKTKKDSFIYLQPSRGDSECSRNTLSSNSFAVNTEDATIRDSLPRF